ncbi:MAG: hypothetical protein JXR48_06155 [Candidatus Delongbacteria bacterium]|nr:hypothetical protein [Candidatus Delongbacteria bacterium]MBN2834534.1 hypothetical protein [Candidatus Delongbacteria bacterium]
MKIITIILFLVLISEAKALELSISTNFQILNSKFEIADKKDEITDKLNTALKNYNWELIPTDVEGVDIDFTVRISKENTEKNLYTISISTISGVTTNGAMGNSLISIRKDIRFMEREETEVKLGDDFSIDMNVEDTERLEYILKFYTYLCIAGNYDRFSYTDKLEFYLLGDVHLDKAGYMLSKLSQLQKDGNWKERVEFYNKYIEESNKELRRLYAYIYNARYFYNKGKKENCSYFVPQINRIINSLSQDDRNIIFGSYYYDLGKIYSTNPDPLYFDNLIELDPVHKKNYENIRKK